MGDFKYMVLDAGVGVDNQKLSSNFNPHLLSISWIP